MRRSLPQLDMHAHVKPTIPARELEGLGAVVFVATRSLDEFLLTQRRRDTVTVWGVGCHPGVEAAQRDFNLSQFADLIQQTAFVAEVGLEGRSKVPIAEQEHTFSAILGELAERPRIVSIHSRGAPGRVLDALATTPICGAVLHWWRGTPVQTARAVELGCWFSVNAAGVRDAADIAHIPLDRILTETDHPSGDRMSPAPRQPGAVQDVEESLGVIHGVSAANIRRHVWVNFSQLVRATAVSNLLPIPVQRMIDSADR